MIALRCCHSMGSFHHLRGRPQYESTGFPLWTLQQACGADASSCHELACTGPAYMRLPLRWQCWLWPGLVLFSYVATHLANHALGLLSLAAMDSGRQWFLAVWRYPIGSVMLYGALSGHVALALSALYQLPTSACRSGKLCSSSSAWPAMVQGLATCRNSPKSFAVRW
jgi:hypothetical protein